MALTQRVLLLIFIGLLLNSAFIIILSINQQKLLQNKAETSLVNTLVQSLGDAIVRDFIDQNKLRVTDLLREITRNYDDIEFIYILDQQHSVFAHSFDNGFPRYLFKNIDHAHKVERVSLIHSYQTPNAFIHEYATELIFGMDAGIHIGINQNKSKKILKENIMQIILGSVVITTLLLIIMFRSTIKTINPLKRLSSLIAEYKEGEVLQFDTVDTKISEVSQLVLVLKIVFEERDRSFKSLKEREQDLLITLNSIGDAVISTDAQGRVVKMNPVAESLTGWTFDMAEGKPMRSVFPIIDANTKEEMQNPAEKVIADGKIIYLSNHTTLIAKDGSEYQIADSAAPIRNSDDEISGVVIVFHDVTQEYKLREQAKSSLEQLERIFENITTLFSVLELDGTVVFANNTHMEITGIAKHDIIGKKFWKYQAIAYDFSVESIVLEIFERVVLRSQSESKDIQIMTLEGIKWINLSAHPVFEESGSISQVIMEGVDISERKNAEVKIAYQAHYDALTGLPNRFLSIDRLSQFINDAKRNNTLVAVLFLDLDNFKKYNDSLGHEIGDEILVATANRLRGVMRNNDIIGRLGGDEFVVGLGNIADILDVHRIAENILRSFEGFYDINGREVKLTTSIGIAIFPNDGENIKELLRNSDTAMYHAKKQGRNTFSFFAEDMNKIIMYQLLLEEKMYSALEDNEFEVHFQPKIEIVSGKIVGAEALLRWYSKDIGSVSPEQFIPVAEKNTFIIRLGNFVISEAMRELSIWKNDICPEFRMAINLSPLQFNDKNLHSTIQEQMIKHNIAATGLEFEITENALIQEEELIIKSLAEFHKIGITVAMDDFGTGYSSLSYLRSYPFDILKIDKSFVMDMMEDRKDRELVGAAISMSKALGLKVVAEGVETKEQFSLLREMGCDYAQGYLLGKPMPAVEIHDLIKKNRTLLSSLDLNTNS